MSGSGRRHDARHLAAVAVAHGCGPLGRIVVLALVPLAFVLFYVVSQGISALNLNFFTHMPAPVGETGGGMANAMFGSLMVTGIGALFAIPIGVVSGVYAPSTAARVSPPW